MITRVKIIAIGKIKEKYLLQGIDEYLKRLNRYCKIEIIELKDEGLEKEAEKLTKYLSKNTFILDANGKTTDSEGFAELFKKEEGEITFIIGGPGGISEKLKKAAKTLSLSKMTFLHEMTRLILLEQIYRAYNIIHNTAYHK